MRDCTEQHDICLIRGDSFTLTVGLGPDWVETVEDANLFEGRLVVRRVQSDAAPDLLVMTAPLTPTSDSRYGDAIALLHFEADSQQTRALPPYDLVCFGEVRGTDGLYTRRLFNGRARVGD